MMYRNRQSLKDRILDGWYYLPPGWKVVILLGLLLILGGLIFWGIYPKKVVSVVPIINPSANIVQSPCQNAISEVEVVLSTASGLPDRLRSYPERSSQIADKIAVLNPIIDKIDAAKQQVLILDGAIEILENWIPGFGMAFSAIDELLNVFRDLRAGMETFTNLESTARAIEEFSTFPDCSALINLYHTVDSAITTLGNAHQTTTLSVERYRNLKSDLDNSQSLITKGEQLEIIGPFLTVINESISNIRSPLEQYANEFVVLDQEAVQDIGVLQNIQAIITQYAMESLNGN